MFVLLSTFALCFLSFKKKKKLLDIYNISQLDIYDIYIIVNISINGEKIDVFKFQIEVGMNSHKQIDLKRFLVHFFIRLHNSGR